MYRYICANYSVTIGGRLKEMIYKYLLSLLSCHFRFSDTRGY